MDNRWASDFKPKTLEVPFSIKDKDGTCGQGCCPSLHPRPDLLAVYSGPQNKALLSPISLAHLSQADGPGKTLHGSSASNPLSHEFCAFSQPPSFPAPCLGYSSHCSLNQSEPPRSSSTIFFIDLEAVSQISREMSLGHR